AFGTFLMRQYFLGMPKDLVPESTDRQPVPVLAGCFRPGCALSVHESHPDYCRHGTAYCCSDRRRRCTGFHDIHHWFRQRRLRQRLHEPRGRHSTRSLHTGPGAATGLVAALPGSSPANQCGNLGIPDAVVIHSVAFVVNGSDVLQQLR
ncbi:hypothetical protein AB0N88_37090, partial [Streptomyces sp. NPDC093516]